MRIAPWVVIVSMTVAAPVSAATINPAFDRLAPRAFSGFVEEGASNGGSRAGRGLQHAAADLFDTHPLVGGAPPANIMGQLMSSPCSAHNRSTPGPGKGGACSGRSGAAAKQSDGAGSSVASVLDLPNGKSGAGSSVASGLDLPNGKSGAGSPVASLLDLPDGKPVDLSDPPTPSTQTVSVVPVPATLTLLLTGCGLLYLVAQRRRVMS